jgi:hypothetical protein
MMAMGVFADIFRPHARLFATTMTAAAIFALALALVAHHQYAAELSSLQAAGGGADPQDPMVQHASSWGAVAVLAELLLTFCAPLAVVAWIMHFLWRWPN